SDVCSSDLDPGHRPVPRRTGRHAERCWRDGGVMRATSQASLDAAMGTWETTLAATGSKAARLGEELFAVVDVLDGSAALRRALTEPNRDGSAKADLVADVFEGKVSGETLDLLSG